jgi:hypothetical protein
VFAGTCHLAAIWLVCTMQYVQYAHDRAMALSSGAEPQQVHPAAASCRLSDTMRIHQASCTLPGNPR